MQTSYKISFLVPTLGSREEIKRLLDSLLKQTHENFEVVFVAQDNFDKMDTICAAYNSLLKITLVKNSEKGLSKARNSGMSFCTGDIIVLSDDDCWYPENAVETIENSFLKDDISVLLTKIYDLYNKREYKTYKNIAQDIKSSFSLLSKSSIEISFKKASVNAKFDEMFGLGAHFVCGEEVDFLINLFKNGNHIRYKPIVTVYHEKKFSRPTKNQTIAKGAIYAKHFGILVSNAVLLRDLILKHQNNYIWFWNGFFDYRNEIKQSKKAES